MVLKFLKSLVFMALLISLAGVTTWLIFQLFMIEQPLPQGVTKVFGGLLIS